MNNLKLLLLTFFSFFFINLSAENTKPVKTLKNKFGIGFTPIANWSNSTTTWPASESLTKTRTLGSILDLAYHFSESVVGHAGVGRISKKSTTTQSNSTNTSTDKISSTIVQASVWKILNIFQKNDRPVLDLGIGLFGIFTTGTNNYSNTFTTPAGTQTNTGSDNVNSIAISLGIRPEWFVNENLTFHT